MYPVSARFLDTITGSHRAVVKVLLCASPPQFGLDPVGVELPILDGDVKLTAGGDVKGTVDLTVPGTYFDDLQPYAGEVWVARGVDYGDGTQELAPLGYFRIDTLDQDHAPNGPLRLSCSDRIASLQQNRVLFPYQVPDGTTHRTIFERLVNGRETPSSAINTAGYAALATVAIPIVWLGYDPDRVTVDGGQVVEDSTYDFLAKLADTKSCVLRFAETGELLVDLRDRDPAAPAVFTIAPGQTGNLIQASRRVSREGVYNIVSAYSSDPETQAAVGYRLAYNADPNSPLRWNGPFGPAPRYYASPYLRTSDDAAAAAAGVLARYTGLPETLGLWTVPNPALRPLDAIAAKVTGLPAVHLIDEVSIPLRIADAGPVEIATRTTNAVADVDVSEPTPVPGSGGWSAAQIAQEKCFQITSTAENSIVAWWEQYPYLEDIGDGRGLTGGIVGFTSATGDMLEVVQDYAAVKPGNVLESFIAGLTTCAAAGIGSSATSLANSNLGAAFASAWVQACNDPVWLKVQRDYRELHYWQPAYDAAQQDGVGVLGLAIYYDTMINHGPGEPDSGDGSFDDIRSATGGGGSSSTLGKTSNGSGSSSASADKTVVSKFTATSTGKVTAGHARLWVDSGSAAVEMVIYADNAGSPGAELGKSDTLMVSNTSEAQKDFTFTGAEQADIVSGTDYHVGFTWPDPGTTNISWSRDATAGQAFQNSAHAADPFGSATTLSGPIDAYVDVSAAAAGAPSNGGNETSWLSDWLDVRWDVLSSPEWDDAQPDGRVPMFRGLLASGNLQLVCPFSWTVYGDNFTMQVDPAPQGSDADTGSGHATTPGQLHNIGPLPGQNHFNLGVGFRPGSQFGSSATHHDFSQDEIANGLSVPGYYELAADGTYVLATSYPDGGKTSSNTKYSRVEYRELQQDGKTKMAFDPSQGRHYVQNRMSFEAPVSSAKPQCVGMQMHDASDDTAMIYLDDETTVIAKVNGTTIGTLDNAYTLGTPTDAMIEVEDGEIRFYWGSLTTPVLTNDAFVDVDAGQYYKTFDYMQWNLDNGGSNPPPARVKMYRLEHWHTGWPKPAVPGSTSGGSGGTGGGSGGGTGTGGGPAVDGVQAAQLLGWGAVVAGDEFDYTGPPKSDRWSMYDGPGHDGNGTRTPDAFTVSGGILTCYGDAGGNTGGMAYKRDKRYCRIEWRVRMYSTSPGNSDPRYHPVLIEWPTSDEWPQGGEFDFLETDIDSGKAEAFLHIPGNDGSAQEYVSKSLDIQNWHNYAFEWAPSGITGWIDGVQWFRYTGSYIQPPGPMHPTFQLDNFFGTRMNPAKFEAMWVRIYQEPS